MGKKQIRSAYVPTINYTYYENKYVGPTVPISIENKIKQFKREGEYIFLMNLNI